MYRLFLGAPPPSEVNSDGTYHWQTFTSNSATSKSPHLLGTQPFILPAATLEAASRRISLIYKNAVFDKSLDEAEQVETPDDSVDDRHGEQTTLFTWPPTEPKLAIEDGRGSKSRVTDATDLCFQMDGSSGELDPTTFLDSRLETQETQSYNYSDASSIARFPTFHFNIHMLTPLAQIPETGMKQSRKVNVLLALLEIEGPDSIRIKKGADVGKEVSILKMILGNEAGNVCKLTAWREIAEEWGGSGVTVAAKRGDILHLQDVLIFCEPSTSPAITASPKLKSEMTICFRTMPYSHEDGRFRPDLRLGESDPCVRKVAAVVRWFEGMAGLAVAN